MRIQVHSKEPNADFLRQLTREVARAIRKTEGPIQRSARVHFRRKQKQYFVAFRSSGLFRLDITASTTQINVASYVAYGILHAFYGVGHDASQSLAWDLSKGWPNKKLPPLAKPEPKAKRRRGLRSRAQTSALPYSNRSSVARRNTWRSARSA